MTVAEQFTVIRNTYTQLKKKLPKARLTSKEYDDRFSEHRRIIASERAIRELESRKDRALAAANRSGFIR